MHYIQDRLRCIRKGRGRGVSQCRVKGIDSHCSRTITIWPSTCLVIADEMRRDNASKLGCRADGAGVV
jgi:hypothetical protein